MDNIYTKIGERIRLRRKAIGIKRMDHLAIQLWGTGYYDPEESYRRKMGRIETGEQPVSIEDILKLSEILQCDVDYLLCLPSCPEPTREVSDAAKLTGLSPKAIEHLQETDYYVRQAGIGETPIPKGIAELTPRQVPSRLMETEEFWRVLGNMARWTSEESRKFIEAYNSTLFKEEVSVPGYLQTNPRLTPFTDEAEDMLLASAASHFRNAAEKVLKDYLKEASADGE